MSEYKFERVLRKCPHNERKQEAKKADEEARRKLYLMEQAAPEMYAALKAQELRQTNQPNPFGHECQWCADCCGKVVRMRREALAKAEGE